MQFFFVFGRHPMLSLAEIITFYQANSDDNIKIKDLDALGEIGIFDINNADIPTNISNLGGIIKAGVILKTIENHKDLTETALKNALFELLEKHKAETGKYNFGISIHGKAGRWRAADLGIKLKKELKNMGLHCRFVTSREKTLSSVVIDTNHLVGKGIELVLFFSGEKLFIGRTLAVQAFKELSKRDYGRPARDDHSGMLPPKLAQMMLNLSRAKETDTILDPFCGSGTIITEAMLMGYENIIGSDISAKAIEDTEKNIEWTKNNFQFPISNFQLNVFNADVLEISNFKPHGSVGAIITEPFLGQQRGQVNIWEQKKQLEKLYSQALDEFWKILRPKGRVVIIFPIFKKQGQDIYLDRRVIGKFKSIDVFDGFKFSINPELFKRHLTRFGTLFYGREGQKVWREIVILEK